MSEPFRCVALAVRQPSATFFVATVKAEDLATICRPLSRPEETGLFGHATPEPLVMTERQLDALVRSLDAPGFETRAVEALSQERQQPYQRFLDERRAVRIADYLEQPDALLPNSIILAVNVELDEGDVVRKLEGGEETGKLGGELYEIVLPRWVSAAVILDGQHRVAGLRYLSEDARANFTVIVVFLIGLPFYQQAELFAVINGSQKPVNRSIIYDLFGYAPVSGRKEEQLYEGLMAVARFCSHVTRLLNELEESPWRGQIRMRGPGDHGLISQAAVVEYLSPMVEPKTYSKRLRTLPLLYQFFREAKPAACSAVLIVYLRAVQAALPESWNNTKSLLWKNNGVAVIFRILHDELQLSGSTDALVRRLQTVVARWKKAPRADLDTPPKTGGGGVQNDLYARFSRVMFSETEREQIAAARVETERRLLDEGALVR